MELCPSFTFYAPGSEFLEPYIKRAMARVETDLAVMVASTDIYEPDPDGILDEEAPLRKESPWITLENDFLAAHPHGIVLRCAPIVGTGMTGHMAQLAKEIYRSMFFHFPGNEARKSVVHASDIAKVVALLAVCDRSALKQHVFNLTDDEDPMIHDIAEALAYRMDNKRISNISTKPQQIFARWFYGKRYTYYTTTERFNGNAIRAALDFTPTPVCYYLRNHVYDESSL